MELTGQFCPGRQAMSDKAKQILKTAETLFAQGRYHEVTLDDICAKAGIGKGTVYRYFKDKEDLFWQVILSGLDEMVESVEAVGTADKDPGAGLREVVTHIFEFFEKRAGLFGLMWSEQFRGSEGKRRVRREWRKRDEAIVGVVAGFIERGTEAGMYATDFPPTAAARMLLGLVRTAGHHWQEMPSDMNWRLAIVDLFERGLLVRPS
jgi:AcrR family transcriptional regulator